MKNKLTFVAMISLLLGTAACGGGGSAQPAPVVPAIQDVAPREGAPTTEVLLALENFDPQNDIVLFGEASITVSEVAAEVPADAKTLASGKVATHAFVVPEIAAGEVQIKIQHGDGASEPVTFTVLAVEEVTGEVEKTIFENDVVAAAASVAGETDDSAEGTVGDEPPPADVPAETAGGTPATPAPTGNTATSDRGCSNISNRFASEYCLMQIASNFQEYKQLQLFKAIKNFFHPTVDPGDPLNEFTTAPVERTRINEQILFKEQFKTELHRDRFLPH